MEIDAAQSSQQNDMISLHVRAFLITFPVSFAGPRNADSRHAHRMQRTPPPPPPGHRGTYRVPTGILTRATYHHQAVQPAVASQPQRGAFQHTQPMAQFIPQQAFPPQPPLFHSTTFHRPPPCSVPAPTHSTLLHHSAPPKRFRSFRALSRLQGRVRVQSTQSSESNNIHPEARHRRLPH